jgi:DNA-binding NarL/FixJ family response regulator
LLPKFIRCHDPDQSGFEH